MARNKKKKSSAKRNQAKEQKLDLSSDSALAWVSLLIALTFVIVLLIVRPAWATQKHKTASAETVQTETSDVTEETTDSSIAYYADITVEGYGTITVALDEKAAPITVDNFVKLAKEGFYDGLTFHRIIDGFMMQGGDPSGNGTGDSGTNIKGEFSANGWENNLSHTRGAISMARGDDYDSASCQFFIVQSDSTYLDGNYACFGYVTEGMEYVDEICANATPTDQNGTILDEEQPVIESIVIRTA